MSTLVGQYLGQYKLLDLLGEGGVASVYRARHRAENSEVAIKVIKPGIVAQEDLSKQIRREALISASLNHPHIVDVFGFGETDNNVYMVMRLVTGGNLANLVQQNRPSLEAIRQILDEVASALDYIHQQGIVHRDIKPQNILMDENGRTLLSDFGMVKAFGESMMQRCSLLDTLWHPTRKGMIVGTPAYMSPEQCRSAPVTVASDIYSLGVVLFELLTGVVPFQGEESIETMYMHLRKEVPPISSIRPDLPPELDAVLAKALSKNPEERFTSAGALAEAYSRAIGSQRVKASANAVGVDKGRTHRLLEFALISVVVVLVALAVITILSVPF